MPDLIKSVPLTVNGNRERSAVDRIERTARHVRLLHFVTLPATIANPCFFQLKTHSKLKIPFFDGFVQSVLDQFVQSVLDQFSNLPPSVEVEFSDSAVFSGGWNNIH